MTIILKMIEKIIKYIINIAYFCTLNFMTNTLIASEYVDWNTVNISYKKNGRSFGALPEDFSIYPNDFSLINASTAPTTETVTETVTFTLESSTEKLTTTSTESTFLGVEKKTILVPIGGKMMPIKRPKAIVVSDPERGNTYISDNKIQTVTRHRVASYNVATTSSTFQFAPTLFITIGGARSEFDVGNGIWEWNYKFQKLIANGTFKNDSET